MLTLIYFEEIVAIDCLVLIQLVPPPPSPIPLCGKPLDGKNKLLVSNHQGNLTKEDFQKYMLKKQNGGFTAAIIYLVSEKDDSHRIYYQRKE